MTLFLGLVFPLRWPFTWCDIFPLPIIIIIVWYLPFIYNYLRVLSPLHPLITCDTPIAYAVHGVDYNILSVTAEQSMESSPTSGYTTTNESGITGHLEGPHITKKLLTHWRWHVPFLHSPSAAAFCLHVIDNPQISLLSHSGWLSIHAVLLSNSIPPSPPSQKILYQPLCLCNILTVLYTCVHFYT